MENSQNVSDFVIVGVGLLIILMAVAIGVYKHYWFIAGMTSMSYEKKKRMDMDYFCKNVGIFLGLLGGIMILGLFVCKWMNVMDYYHRLMPFVVLAIVSFMILYLSVIKRSRVFGKSDQ